MLRNVFKIAVGLGQRSMNCKFSVFPSRSSRYYFSKPVYHPTIQKILAGQAVSNLDNILKQLKGLNDKDRQIALKLLLKNIYAQKVPYHTLLDQQFVIQARKHPQIYIDSTLYKIKALIHQLDQVLQLNVEENKQKIAKVFGDITQSFNICFQEFKKIPKEEALRPGIMINKRFADYYLIYLSELTSNSEQKEAVLKRISFVYRQIITEMTKLINQEGSRLRLMEETPLGQKETQQDKQFRLNSAKESIRVLVQTNSENVLHLFKAINLLYKLKKNQKDYNEGVIETISNIERAVTYYDILKDMNLYSIFYLHLKKVKAELNYFYKSYALKQQGGSKQQLEEQSRKLDKQLDVVYGQASENLQKLGSQMKYMSNVVEISLLMLGLKIEHISAQKIELDDFKNKMLEQVKTILEKISNLSNRKSASSKLAGAVKSTLKYEEARRQRVKPLDSQKKAQNK